jgi:uncharacterized membrane protein
MKDRRIRSLAKSATWRIISIVVLVTVSYIVTGDVKKTTWITIFFQVILAILYYGHERIWEKTPWGRG